MLILHIEYTCTVYTKKSYLELNILSVETDNFTQSNLLFLCKYNV